MEVKSPISYPLTDAELAKYEVVHSSRYVDLGMDRPPVLSSSN